MTLLLSPLPRLPCHFPEQGRGFRPVPSRLWGSGFGSDDATWCLDLRNPTFSLVCRPDLRPQSKHTRGRTGQCLIENISYPFLLNNRDLVPEGHKTHTYGETL